MPKKPGPLAQKLKEKMKRNLDRKLKEPLWKGPEDKGPLGGVTQSMLGRFLTCRERFRIQFIEGLRPAETFRAPIEYGNLWHLCEEHHANNEDWEGPLVKEAQKLIDKYRYQQEQVDKWYNVCRVQFPIYVKYWQEHSDVKHRTPLFQEEVFHVPYRIPSGRTVWLKGKWDSVDLIGTGSKARVFLQENKTKGQVIEDQIQSQLTFDLQSMMYLTALWTYYDHAKAGDKLFDRDYGPPAGVRYNVIRRPLSGGKGSIKQHKPTKKNPAGESNQEYYDRLAAVIKEDLPSFFIRWKVLITAKDLERFRTTFFDPMLEQLCGWYDWVAADPDDPWRINPDNGLAGGGVHWRHPYGVYNVLNEGGRTDLDEYLLNGSTTGLVHVKTLFNELAE